MTKVEKLHFLIGETIKLLEAGKECAARDFFNNEIFSIFSKIIMDDSEPVSHLRFFLLEMDEYFNSVAARLFGQATKEKIIGSFYSDYQQDVEKAKKEGAP